MLAQSSHHLLQEFGFDNVGGHGVCGRAFAACRCLYQRSLLKPWGFDSHARKRAKVLQPLVRSHPHLLYCPLRTDTENIHHLAVFPCSCVVPCLFSLLSCSMSPLFISLRLRVSPSLPVSRNSGGRCLALVPLQKSQSCKPSGQRRPRPLSARPSLAKPNSYRT